MPDPPDRSTFQHLFFEEPLLLVIALGLAGAVVAWQGMREGLRQRLLIGVGLIAAGAGIFGVSEVVTTPAEHGRATVVAFVEAVGRLDVAATDRLLHEEATVHSGREENPGVSRASVLAGVRLLQGYGLESVGVGSLEAWPDGRGGAVMHLAAVARTDNGVATPTRWVLRAEPDATDGTWRVRRLTWIDLVGQPPPSLPGR